MAETGQVTAAASNCLSSPTTLTGCCQPVSIDAPEFSARFGMSATNHTYGKLPACCTRVNSWSHGNGETWMSLERQTSVRGLLPISLGFSNPNRMKYRPPQSVTVTYPLPHTRSVASSTLATDRRHTASSSAVGGSS